MTNTLDLLRLAPVAVVVLSAAGRVTDFNLEVQRLLQCDAGGLKGCSFTQHLSARCAPDFLKHLWDAFQQPTVTHSRSLEVLLGDGSTKVVVMTSLALPRPGGLECANILVEARDLAGDLGRELFARLDLGLVLLNPQERILECNAAFSSLFEYPAAQLEQCPLQSLFQDWTTGAAAGSALMTRPVRLQGVRRDGQVIPVEARLLEARLDQGDVVYLFIARDLRAQEALERRSLRIADLERRAIGRELHDALGQNLVGMAFLADELAVALGEARLKEETAEQLSARARRLAEICRDTNSIARNLVRGLVPIGLEKSGGGLSSALRDLANSCSTTYGIQCQVQLQAGDVATEISEHLFRIAQEAVTNAVKHSGCTEIDLRLEEKDERLVLTVTDNGVGLDPDHTQNFGTGLHSMRHRCALIRGRLAVTTVAKEGTSISVSLSQSGEPPEDAWPKP